MAIFSSMRPDSVNILDDIWSHVLKLKTSFFRGSANPTDFNPPPSQTLFFPSTSPSASNYCFLDSLAIQECESGQLCVHISSKDVSDGIEEWIVQTETVVHHIQMFLKDLQRALRY
jgi:hypothetical protein